MDYTCMWHLRCLWRTWTLKYLLYAAPAHLQQARIPKGKWCPLHNTPSVPKAALHNSWTLEQGIKESIASLFGDGGDMGFSASEVEKKGWGRKCHSPGLSHGCTDYSRECTDLRKFCRPSDTNLGYGEPWWERTCITSLCTQESYSSLFQCEVGKDRPLCTWFSKPSTPFCSRALPSLYIGDRRSLLTGSIRRQHISCLFTTHCVQLWMPWIYEGDSKSCPMVTRFDLDYPTPERHSCIHYRTWFGSAHTCDQQHLLLFASGAPDGVMSILTPLAGPPLASPLSNALLDTMR